MNRWVEEKRWNGEKIFMAFQILVSPLHSLCGNRLMLASVVYKRGSPTTHTQEGCNCGEETYAFKLSISRNVLWVSFTYTISIMTLAARRLVFTILLKPFIKMLPLKSAFKKANQEQCEQAVRKELVIISHTLIYRFSLPLPKCLVI